MQVGSEQGIEVLDGGAGPVTLGDDCEGRFEGRPGLVAGQSDEAVEQSDGGIPVLPVPLFRAAAVLVQASPEQGAGGHDVPANVLGKGVEPLPEFVDVEGET